MWSPRRSSPWSLSLYPGSVPTPVRLADVTTLRLGGPAPELVTVTTRRELDEAMRTFAGQDILVLGGGSNLVISDDGVPGPVVRIGIRGVGVKGDEVTIGAGEDWDAVVEQLVGEGLTGLAPLSGIPGSSGATPVQNVGAYGTEISELLESVTLYDRATGDLRSVPAAELGLAYRSSTLRGTNRAVVVDITLRLTRAPTVVKYAELARALGVAPGATAPERAIRTAVLGLRRSKGMVIEAGTDDPDTRSAGSFFTNPMLDPDQLAVTDAAIRAVVGMDALYPCYPADGGRQKLSAAWLIERAGFGKGYDGPGGRVGISTKHTLALVNRGGSTADLVALARQIRDGVQARFAVELHPEPVFVGISLD